MTEETVEGVLLQASYRIEAGLPVVHLFGRLLDGRTFLVRDGRQRPHFYVRAEAAEAALRAGGSVVDSPRRTMAGTPVVRVEVRIPQDAPGVRDKLHAGGVETFEADVRFAMRYLIDRNVRGGCRIAGATRSGNGVDVVFENPDVAPAAVRVEPVILSFDIETNPRSNRLLAISLWCATPEQTFDEVVIVDPARREMPERALGVATEKAALAWFCERVRRIDPDVLTGWNVIDFDLAFLQRAAERLGVSFEFGRGTGALRVRAAEGYFGSGQASVPGRVVLDGMDLVRGAFLRLSEYSLDAVSREILGEGKALHGDAKDRLGEILDGYANDLPGFARYARTDARLPAQIIAKLDLVRLAFERSALTGMTPDRVAASIASFDFCYLSALGPRGVVAPSVTGTHVRVAAGGGHVLPSKPGMHPNVWVFDFKSLYPSIMRTFNIDPLEYRDGPGADTIELPSAHFSREPGILPAMLDELFPQRAEAKRAGNVVASQAIKILMNSFYGVLGTPACRFYNPHIANAITGQGRYLLLWSQAWFEDRGLAVLYGDTDSLFVAADAAEPAAARAHADRLAGELNADLAAHIRERWGRDSRLELESEKFYDRLLLPNLRHSDDGARKRYVGHLAGAPQDELDFVGMEVVRRDWTDLAKRVQRELYVRLFADRPVDDFLRATVTALRAGDLDEELTYRKGLRKPVTEYTASSPPHVQAARKSAQPNARVVRYRMTVAGPEPMDALTHAPDYEHYLERQIRPIAEPVLRAADLVFDRVIGDDRQIDLF
ncbi:MAG: DNA polymerase II [Pseudomonadota bacterium]